MPSPSVRHNFAKLTPTSRARLISEYGVNGFFGRITTVRTTDLWLPDASGVYQQYGSGEVGIINGDAIWSQPGATNLCLHSADFTQAAWEQTDTTVRDALAPDGSNDATTITETTDLENYTTQAITTTVTAGQKYTASCWLRASSPCNALLTLARLGAGAFESNTTNCAVTTEWQRFSVTHEFANDHTGLSWRFQRPGVGTRSDTIIVWGAQVETGAFPTSYIPTAGSAVTINATQPRIVTPNPTTNFAGRFIWRPAAASQGAVWLLGNYTDANNAWGVLHDGTNVIFRNRVAGSNNDAVKALAYSADTDYLIQFRHDTINGLDIAIDGTVGTNDATTTAVANAANTFLQQDGNQASHATGSIRDLRFIQHAAGWTDSEWLAS